MKKGFTAFLVLCAALFTLSGCGGEDTTAGDTPNVSGTTQGVVMVEGFDPVPQVPSN